LDEEKKDKIALFIIRRIPIEMGKDIVHAIRKLMGKHVPSPPPKNRSRLF